MMKERRQRTMGDFTAEAAIERDLLDYVITQRFKAERHPKVSVDGDDRWAYDPFEERE